MVYRTLLPLLFTLGLSNQAFACSCAPWSGHISEFTEDHISVWAVPTKATVNTENIGTPFGGVTYKLEILESFDRILQTDIDVFSNVADGGSCGIQPILGLPQFFNVSRYDTNRYGLSSCTPRPPYGALKRYLETGEDSFIPEWSKCHTWPKDAAGHSPIFNTELEACAVWKDADYIDGYYGAADRRDYLKVWWNKVESAEPKKRSRWWPFKKD